MSMITDLMENGWRKSSGIVLSAFLSFYCFLRQKYVFIFLTVKSMKMTSQSHLSVSTTTALLGTAKIMIGHESKEKTLHFEAQHVKTQKTEFRTCLGFFFF